MRHGVKVAIKSDSDDYMRRLNQEAAKTMRYGGATEDEAMQMLTINPAWIMGIDDKTGSIDVGKDADLVLWSGYPLSSYGIPEKVWIDGDVYFDRGLAGAGHAAVPGGTVMTKTALSLFVSSLFAVRSSLLPVDFRGVAGWNCDGTTTKRRLRRSFPQRALDPTKPIAITGGKLLTITHGTIENGVVVIENGKIAAVGASGIGASSRLARR